MMRQKLNSYNLVIREKDKATSSQLQRYRWPASQLSTIRIAFAAPSTIENRVLQLKHNKINGVIEIGNIVGLLYLY